MTRDIDIVVAATAADYEGRIRRAFEPDFLVNDAIDLGERWLGGLIQSARDRARRPDLRTA